MEPPILVFVQSQERAEELYEELIEQGEASYAVTLFYSKLFLIPLKYMMIADSVNRLLMVL